MRLAYRAHLAWSFQCGPPNFVIFNLGFILTYSIDLNCLAFVVNGAGVNIIGGPLQYGIPNFFHAIVLPMLKILFFFKLEWLKILKDIFEENYPICGKLKLVITLSFPFCF